MAYDAATVHAILVNWNGWRDTVECLASLYRSDHPGLRVVVCDNGSSDDSLDHIRQWARGAAEPLHPGSPLPSSPDARARRPATIVEYTREAAEQGGDPGDGDAQLVLIDAGANLGFAGANNVCLRYLMRRGAAGYAWLLNNDTVVAPDAARRLAEHLDRDPTVGAVGSTLRRYHEPDQLEMIGGARLRWRAGFPVTTPNLAMAQSNGRRGAIDFVAGTSLLARIATFEQVGLIDERYFLYCEDTDWSYRVRAAGMRLACAPASIVWHKGGGSVGHSSPLHDYYVVKSGLLFAHRFARAWLPAALLYAAWHALLPKIVRREWPRARAVLQAYRDFLRQLRRAPAEAIRYQVPARR